MFTSIKNRKGFTLIEIVIVIVIIAILAAILVPNLTRWIAKAKLSNDKEELRVVVQEIAGKTIEKHDDEVEITNDVLKEIADEAIENIGAHGTIDSISYSEDNKLHINYTAKDGNKLYYCQAGGSDDCGAESEYGEGTINTP